MTEWQRSGPEPGKDYSDILYETAEGIAKITINRPEVRNAFRPTTLFELSNAFNVARDDPGVFLDDHSVGFCAHCATSVSRRRRSRSILRAAKPPASFGKLSSGASGSACVRSSSASSAVASCWKIAFVWLIQVASTAGSSSAKSRAVAQR